MALIPSRRIRRLGALAALVAFASGWAVDVGGLHDCPHHDLAPPAGAHSHHQADDQHLADDHHQKDDHPPHGDHDPHHDHPSSHHSDSAPSLTVAESSTPASHHDHHDGPCTCRTDCTGASPMGTGVSTSVERVPAQTPMRTWVPQRAPTPAHIHVPHLLPWPTAPPRI